MFQQIKESLDIKQVLSYYNVKLDYHNKSLCPLHNEKVKSFKVYENKQRFKCFSCNKSGSIIDFVKYHFYLSDYDSCKKLSEDFNLGLFDETLSIEEKQRIKIKQLEIKKQQKFERKLREKKEDKIRRVNEMFIEYDKLCERYKPKFPKLSSDLFIYLNNQKEYWWEQVLKID